MLPPDWLLVNYSASLSVIDVLYYAVYWLLVDKRPPDWLLVFFAASWLAIGILCCPLIGYWSQVAEHINEMQRIHEEYGAIFDHLFRQHHKSSKQVSWYLV